MSCRRVASAYGKRLYSIAGASRTCSFVFWNVDEPTDASRYGRDDLVFSRLIDVARA